MKRDGWQTVALGDLCTRITDGAHASPKTVENGLPMASVKDLSVHGINLQSCRQISEDDFKKLEAWHCRPLKGDVLLAKDGAKAAETACLMQENLEVVLLSSIAIVRPDPAKVDPAYLTYFLRSPRTIKYVRQGFMSGAAIPRIIVDDVRRLEVPVPAIDLQREISLFLSRFDDLIENNRRRIEILEEMARLLYREWFVHFRFPGHEGVEMVDSELGPIPEGWVLTSTAALISAGELEIGDGYRAKNAEMTGGPLRFLRVKNVQEGFFADLDCADSFPDEYAEVAGPKVAQPGDVAIAMKGSVGRLARVRSSMPPIVYSPQVSYWRAHHDARLNSTFLYQWMQGPSFVQQCAMVKGSTDMADYVNLNDQRRMRIVVPAKAAVEAFSHQVDSMQDLASNLRQQNQVLREARDLLLPRLVSGELDVSDLDLDEVLA